ncbi:MAG: TIGR01777 family oxidoreductase [Bacteroidota bacterium]
METVLITGGTGLIGKALTNHLLEKGYSVIILSRQYKKSSRPNVSFGQWDVSQQTIDIDAIQKADHIVHLAGAGVVDKKWTAAYKKEIQDSRIKSSELLINTLQNTSNNVKTIVSASAIGFYQATDILHTEEEPADDSFLGETCKLWETSIQPVTTLNKRLVILRTGIVLSKDGGALAEFKKPIKFGIAAIIANGKQIVSWVHIDDLCKLYIAAIENPNLSGTYNAVATSPVSNKELTMLLAKKMKGRFFIPMYVPAFVLKIMLGGRSIEVLKSNAVSNKKILEAGFEFDYATIDEALENLK